jgi:hypothetical protein
MEARMSVDLDGEAEALARKIVALQHAAGENLLLICCNP